MLYKQESVITVEVRTKERKTLLSSECKPPQVAQSTKENGFEMEDRKGPVTSQSSVEVVLREKASIDGVIIGMLQ